MSGIITFLEERWAIVKPAGWTILVVALATCGAGFGAATFLSSASVSAAHEQRDLYRNCLETGARTPECAAIAKNAPKPPPDIKYVRVTIPVPDPVQTKRLEDLERELRKSQAARTPDVPVAPQAKPVVTTAKQDCPPGTAICINGGIGNSFHCIRYKGDRTAVSIMAGSANTFDDVQTAQTGKLDVPCAGIGQIPEIVDPSLSKLSNQVVRNLVFQYARQLRDLETQVPMSGDGQSMMRAYERVNNVFQADLKVRGLALRNEMLHRLKKPMTNDLLAATGWVQPDFPNLAGPRPLTGLASTMDSLATALAD